jgi:hypothetical protein
MKYAGVRGIFSILGISLILTFAFQLYGQTSQPANLYKEIMTHKKDIQWRTAPAGVLPSDVCDLFRACYGNKGEPKLYALKPATEGGTKVGRGLFLSLTGDPKNPEAIILMHQTPTEIYYFLIGPDGSIQKTAYGQYGSKSWTLIATELAQPTYNSDQKQWVDWAKKLSSAPHPKQAEAATPSGR